jgi:hypothetical protein
MLLQKITFSWVSNVLFAWNVGNIIFICKEVWVSVYMWCVNNWNAWISIMIKVIKITSSNHDQLQVIAIFHFWKIMDYHRLKKYLLFIDMQHPTQYGALQVQLQVQLSLYSSMMMMRHISLSLSVHHSRVSACSSVTTNIQNLCSGLHHYWLSCWRTQFTKVNAILNLMATWRHCRLITLTGLS